MNSRLSCLTRPIHVVAGLICLLSAVVVQAAPPNEAGLEARVARMERLLESQGLLRMYQQIEALEQDVRELRGQMEQNQHKLDGIQRRQRDLYLDIDRRLRALEVAGQPRVPAPAGQPSAPGVVPAPPAAEPAEPASQPPAVTAQAEDAAYRKAFNLLKEGSYARAAKGFRALLDSYPNGIYAANAQYWLGEAYYVTRDFEAALAEFRKVLERYPASPKVADARLKLGYIHYELKQWAKAREMLESVVARYAGSRAARLASQRLERMKSEGH